MLDPYPAFIIKLLTLTSISSRMLLEDFIALVVSNLLSAFGLATTTDRCFIHVPSLNRTFIVTLSCSSWVVISLQAFTYVFIMWVYLAFNGFSMRHRTYLTLGTVGFISFFLTNILRILTEIYLLGKVYHSVYQHYLVHWQAYEEQVGMGLMFATLIMLSLLSYAVLKRGMKRARYPYTIQPEYEMDNYPSLTANQERFSSRKI